MRFVCPDGNFHTGEVDIAYGQVGQFRDAHPGLKKHLDDGGNAGVGTTGVAQGTIFEFTENSGWFEVVFGVTDGGGGINLDQVLGLEEAEKGFDGV